MNYKKIKTYDSQSVNSNLVHTPTSYLNVRRELIWIIFVSIAAILIMLTIMNATAILTKTKGDAQKTRSTMVTRKRLATVTMASTTRTGPPMDINVMTKWIQNGITVAGGRGPGRRLNQLYYPDSIYVDNDDQSILIDEWQNDRIVKWKYGATSGQIVAGGKGPGNRTDQLHNPSYMVVDKKNHSMFICDHGNRRIVRWPRHNNKNGQKIISDINCLRLAIDNNEDIYFSDHQQHVVRRWRQGDTYATIVAGGNGQGNNLNQLNIPTYIFVDEDYSVYVSDQENHRVIKWLKGAKEGIIVAGGHGNGKNLTQLSYPEGLFVDLSDNVYVADNGNHRIVRWSKRSKEGTIILGGNDQGNESNQFDDLRDLSFDQQGSLYVIDNGNQRIQKFYVDPK